MLKIHSEPPKPELVNSGPAILALGFRPFFSFAGLAAVLLLSLWLGIWAGAMRDPEYYGGIFWHSHEMLFGYAAAVIAGFLLTAVRNWTGAEVPTGTHLALLALLWLAGRVAPLLTGILPAPVIALIDLAFLPAVALSLVPPLWKGQQKINRIFVPLLLVMGIANLLVHLQSLDIADSAGHGIDMMLYLVVFLITIIAGRVVPFFTQAVISGYQASRKPQIELVSTLALGLLALMQPFGLPGPVVGLVALVVAVTQFLRVLVWYDRRIWGIPILWVLYSGYFWLILGFLLLGLSGFGVLPANLAKHALTVGGIGVLTLGMMTRVTLGHTGHPIDPSPLMLPVFVLLNLAAAVRVFAALVWPQHYNLWVYLSGGLWVLCFLVFSAIYLPMLFRPRADGKPG
ncbi:MAG TPA: NnrS family protein [Gammaproteobacteria bacterium]|nr:NnrS family protein [Gammaproteobacteria bacterium]